MEEKPKEEEKLKMKLAKSKEERLVDVSKKYRVFVDFYTII